MIRYVVIRLALIAFVVCTCIVLYDVLIVGNGITSIR